jgi:hypothetical protein
MKRIIMMSLAIAFMGLFFPAASYAQRVGHPPVGFPNHPLPSGSTVAAREGLEIDSMIVKTIEKMNADTVLRTLRDLQNFGTRFLMLDSRKEIADWLASKFVSYGYTDVRLDSFLCIVNWPGQWEDTLWQYNVIARLEGASAPDEVYVIGGHYDSYSNEDPYNNAPGVDDNGSAVAAAFEVARVMKLMEYQAEATIEFSLFAAEELGLFGSRHLAATAVEEHRDIRYVLNMDMIANNPDSVPLVSIGKYHDNEWAAFACADSYNSYTALEAIVPDTWDPTGSDSYAYFLFGFPSIFVKEIAFSPHWHLLSDTVGNCNIGYLTEVARGACATLMEQQNLPYPGQLWARSTPESIQLTWQQTGIAKVAGYNVYRSEIPDTGFIKLNTTLVTDSFFLDDSGIKGKPYFYKITRVSGSMVESQFSPVASGAIYAFTDTLLVINTLKLSQSSPDSIRLFYEAVMDTIPFEWYDLNRDQPFGLDLLATHKNILWTANTTDYEQFLAPSYPVLKDFFDNGGNMMLSACNPGKLLGLGSSYPIVPEEGSIMRDFFKADTAGRNVSSLMYRAYPSEEGYDTIRIDLHKSMTPGYPGEIFNVEVYAPATEGNVIYRFDSRYSPASQFGKSQDKPVGLEYIGNDFRTILLGFPLFYLDTADASALVKYVMNFKFTHPTAIPGPSEQEPSSVITAYPNPFRADINIGIRLEHPADGKLFVINIQGSNVADIYSGHFRAGPHSFRFNAADLPAGLYQVILSTGTGIHSCKIFRIP